MLNLFLCGALLQEVTSEHLRKALELLREESYLTFLKGDAVRRVASA